MIEGRRKEYDAVSRVGLAMQRLAHLNASRDLAGTINNAVKPRLKVF